MSGGETAIRGFDYQATVILDELLTHFEMWGEEGLVRPEGEDDLDLFGGLGPIREVVHVQVKKPRQDATGEPAPSPWTIAEAVSELLPQSLKRLTYPSHRQVWVLGDEVTPELAAVVASGPSALAETYLTLIHLLARNEAMRYKEMGASDKKRLQAWRPSAIAGHAVEENIQDMADEFCRLVGAQSVNAGELLAYRATVARLQAQLPSMLSRIEIRASNGLEQTVANRVNDRLSAQYNLKPTIVRETLFRNLRGFVSDISKQHGRRVTRAEFELEIRTVWPEMVPLKAPPFLEEDHVRRNDITDVLLSSGSKIVEVVGVSGSGKSSLAAEAIERLTKDNESDLAYYVEVRRSTRFRDVLAGLTFSLRRFGAGSAFGLAVDGTDSSEGLASRVARSLSDLTRPISIFLDLVDGSCDAEFSRELCLFVRQTIKAESNLRFVVLGQERTLKNFTAFDREALGVGQLDVRGFEFEELCRLVEARHSSLSRDTLWRVFERVTKGKTAGLIAARARSIADMSPELALSVANSSSPEKMIEQADRERFGRIAAVALDAARKLVCFALPFSASQAASAFPDDNVRDAIEEMLHLGLLRRYDDTSFEMHETLRAGLESGLAINVRRTAHKELADWYFKSENTPAVVFHLDEAGRHDEACAAAREAFCKGHFWPALRDYVAMHKLVSMEEAVELFTIAKENGKSYLLTELFRGEPNPNIASLMIELLRALPPDAYSDWSWASNFMQAILHSDPGKLQQLLEYALEAPETGGDTRMAYLGISISRVGVPIDTGSIDFFNHQQPEAKRRLLPLFVASGRRDALAAAFAFLDQSQYLFTQHNRPTSHQLRIDVSDLARAREFLAALPQRDCAQMLVRKSVLLDPLLGLIWAQRRMLRKFCVQLLESCDSEPVILQGAARVLVALGEPTLLTLCDPLKPADQATRSLFQFLPALVPWLANREEYESRILDRNVEVQSRLSLIPTVLALGSDLGVLLDRLRAEEPNNASIWEYLMLRAAVQRPFKEGIPLVARRLQSSEQDLLLPVLVSGFGRLACTEARQLLLDALHHPSTWVRMASINALTQLRDQSVSEELIGRLAIETDQNIAQGIVVAIVACHPDIEITGKIDWSRFSALRIWRIILAGRLRDVREAHEITAVATDVTQRWLLRRAAILAAGTLGDQETLEHIHRALRDERSLFLNDRTYNLKGHELAINLLSNGLPFFFERFLEERAEFVTLVAGRFNSDLSHEILRNELPAGQIVAEWIYDQLVAHNYPSVKAGVDDLIDKLQVPVLQAALLRSLRICGRFDLLEKEAGSAYSLWYLVRSILEFRYSFRSDPSARERARTIVENSKWATDVRLQNLVPEALAEGGPHATITPSTSSTSEAHVPRRTFTDATAAEVIAALNGSMNLDLSVPLRLGIDSQQRFMELVRELNPSNDYVRELTPKAASLRFTTGGYLVNDGQHPHKENKANLRAFLRPAIAAANEWEVEIAWHSEVLEVDQFDMYAGRFIDCLLAKGDASLFYRELAKHEGVLVPSILGSKIRAQNTKPIADGRMVPFLSRHIGSGSDAFLLGLSTVTEFIDSADIDSVLEGLLVRWLSRFNPESREFQHAENHDLWVAFHRLSKHPRFERIPDWDIRLEPILAIPTFDFRRYELLKVLSRSPRSYRTIECQLFRCWSLEHPWRDIVDTLDNEADRLFRS
jgi:hypothetical protein